MDESAWIKKSANKAEAAYVASLPQPARSAFVIGPPPRSQLKNRATANESALAGLRWATIGNPLIRRCHLKDNGWFFSLRFPFAKSASDTRPQTGSGPLAVRVRIGQCRFCATRQALRLPPP
jgi:hypothetical protein